MIIINQSGRCSFIVKPFFSKWSLSFYCKTFPFYIYQIHRNNKHTQDDVKKCISDHFLQSYCQLWSCTGCSWWGMSLGIVSSLLHSFQPDCTRISAARQHYATSVVVQGFGWGNFRQVSNIRLAQALVSHLFQHSSFHINDWCCNKL